MSERPSEADFQQNEADGRAAEAEWLEGFFADGHEVRAADPNRPDGVPIASLARSLLPTEEIHALARVFAASPMLLATLITIRDADDDCARDGLRRCVTPIVRTKLDAAIAKAEGRTS